MAEIVAIEGATVRVGGEDGAISSLPIAALRYSNPQVGDQVRVYRDASETVVTRAGALAQSSGSSADGDRRRVNKVLYVLMAFFFGGFGVHRFLRGQVGLGVLMILVGWLTAGIWWLVDFIISLVKLPAYPGEDYVFTADGRWVK